MIYQPLNGHLYPTHRLADEWNLLHQIYPDAPGTHRHHVDHDRRNNRPWNIIRMEAGEHIRHHNLENYGEEFDPNEHSASIRAALATLMKDPEWRRRYSLSQRERAMRFWHDEEYAAIRDRVLQERQHISEETPRHSGKRCLRVSAIRPNERDWLSRRGLPGPGMMAVGAASKRRSLVPYGCERRLTRRGSWPHSTKLAPFVGPHAS